LELTRAFFERDLSADEAEQLGVLLQDDPRAAEALLAQAQEHYRACGLPEPSWASRPKRGLPRGLFWGAGLLLAAGLGAAFVSDDRTPIVPVAVAVAAPDREVALAPRKAAPQSRPRPSGHAAYELQAVLTLQSSGNVQVTVQDSAGRVRRKLFQGYWAAGEHALPWNGLDSDGRPVPAGTYRVVVSGAGQHLSEVLQISR
jgi:hypothetical protein